MATGQGTAILDFGTGSNEASTVVTGQSTISATSKVEAYVMAGDSTSDHTPLDHRYFALLAARTCDTPVANTGFTIYATSLEKLNGTYTVRWVWAD